MDSTPIIINVCIVSYRDKRIVETAESAYSRAIHKNNIKLLTFIQDSHWHKIKKTDRDVVVYGPWDHFEGFSKMRHSLVNAVPKNEYILFASSATAFSEGWDEKIMNLIHSHDDNVVFSLTEDKFNINGTLIKKDVFNKIGYPTYLRLLGEEEDLSIRLYANGYKVLSSIDSILTPLEQKNHDYTPFSQNHGYNNVYELYQTGKNKFVDLTNCQFSWAVYAEKYPIKKIIHQLDDVEYTNGDIVPPRYERFHGHGNRI